MGVATSSVTFGRSLGGAIGAALFGALMTSQLAVHLGDTFGDSVGSASSGGEINTNNVQAIRALAEPTRTEVLSAYTSAITDVFLMVIPVIVVALVVVLFLKEIPLRSGQPQVAKSTEDQPASTSEIDTNAPAFSGH
jgi:hypothetical protein